MSNFLLTLGLLVLFGCPKKNDSPPPPPPTPPPPTAGGDRVAAVSSDHPLHARVEGTSFKNDCTGDDACKTGGCSSEVCTAEEGVNTTCEMPAEGFPKGAGCGCVSGQCVWYNTGSSSGPKQGEPCPEGRCGEGLTCMQYYGVAGPSGPKFSSCEVPCPDDKSTCPEGQGCTTIADGPGRVCRPAR